MRSAVTHKKTFEKWSHKRGRPFSRRFSGANVPPPPEEVVSSCLFLSLNAYFRHKCDTLPGSRDCLRWLVHGSSGLRPLTRGYGAGTHKGCLPAAWRTVLSDGAMPYRTSRTGRTSAVPIRTGRTGRRSLRGSYGSRQGSPLHSHRSSRDSGDDLWADRPLDLDPARVSHTRGELDSATP